MCVCVLINGLGKYGRPPVPKISTCHVESKGVHAGHAIPTIGSTRDVVMADLKVRPIHRHHLPIKGIHASDVIAVCTSGCDVLPWHQDRWLSIWDAMVLNSRQQEQWWIWVNERKQVWSFNLSNSLLHEGHENVISGPLLSSHFHYCPFSHSAVSQHFGINFTKAYMLQPLQRFSNSVKTKC